MNRRIYARDAILALRKARNAAMELLTSLEYAYDVQHRAARHMTPSTIPALRAALDDNEEQQRQAMQLVFSASQHEYELDDEIAKAPAERLVPLGVLAAAAHDHAEQITGIVRELWRERDWAVVTGGA